MRRYLLAAGLLAVLGLLPQNAQAKAGPGEFLTLRISGGDLPHPVTVTLVESTLTMLTGSRYGEPDQPEPPASRARYLVEHVFARRPQNAPYETWLYVPGTSPMVKLTTGPEEGAGWAQLVPLIAGLFDRYIELALGGLIDENPTFAQVLDTSAKMAPARVTIGGRELSLVEAEQVLPLLGQIEPIYYGVQGRMIGSRDLHKAEIKIRFDSFDLTFAYVPPYAVANFGLLFGPSMAGNWDLIGILDPPGYAQIAYDPPSGFESLMAELGVGTPIREGVTAEGIVLPRTVPLLDVTREVGIDHLEVWRGDEAHTIVPYTGADSVCAPYPNEAPEPTTGEPLNVFVWWKGMQPFPEAVVPALYAYYPPQTDGERGVLVQRQAGAIYNGGPMSMVDAPCHAATELDALLSDGDAGAAIGSLSRVDGRGHSMATGLLVGLLAAGMLAFMLRMRSAANAR